LSKPNASSFLQEKYKVGLAKPKSKTAIRSFKKLELGLEVVVIMGFVIFLVLFSICVNFLFKLEF
jgi:hypothetical protein